jgi:hypothetical protein
MPVRQASRPTGDKGSFAGVKRPRREAENSPPSSVEVQAVERSWLRHYAAGQKVAGSISDEVIGVVYQSVQ